MAITPPGWLENDLDLQSQPKPLHPWGEGVGTLQSHPPYLKALGLLDGFAATATIFGTGIPRKEQRRQHAFSFGASMYKKPALRLSFEGKIQSSDGGIQDIIADNDRLAIAVSSEDSDDKVQGEGDHKTSSEVPIDGAILDFLNNRRHSRQRFFGEQVCYTFDLEPVPQSNPPEPVQREKAEEGFHSALGQVFGVPLHLYDDAEEYVGPKEFDTKFNAEICSVWRGHYNVTAPLALLEPMLPYLGVGSEQAPLVKTALQQYQAEHDSNNVTTAVAGVPAIFSTVASFCVTDAGHLLETSVIRTLSVNPIFRPDLPPHKLWQKEQRSNSTYSPGWRPSPSDFNEARRAASGHCMDLTQGHVGANELKFPVNSASRLSRINSEAAGHWEAVAYDIWHDAKVENIIPLLGTEIRPLRLQLQTGLKTQSPLTGGSLFGQSQQPPLPQNFDPRKQWPMCPSLGIVRNQGGCGSCWAVAAATVLTDRICIASARIAFKGWRGASFLQTKVNASYFANFALAPGHMVDCDQVDGGCGGGRLDDAWWFLRDHGVPLERCRPYRFCPIQSESSCLLDSSPEGMWDTSKPGSSVAGLMETTQGDYMGCAGDCLGGRPMDLFHASTAYAVSAPGDVKGMQRELFLHGPVEVAFFVFSDFQSYRKGVYFRTPGAYGPLGGHAVRLLGWGKNFFATPYWLVSNSWSARWGVDGNFQIRRGTNECGIESTPAAGRAKLWESTMMR